MRTPFVVVRSVLAVGFVATLSLGGGTCVDGSTPEPEGPPPPNVLDADGNAIESGVAATGRWTRFDVDDTNVASVEVDLSTWDIKTLDNAIYVRPQYVDDAAAEDASRTAVVTVNFEVFDETGRAESGQFDFEVTRQDLQWRKLGDVVTSPVFPPGREYFAWWADADDPDTAWLVGGFQYQPEQFTPANDLFSLDLTTDRWTDHGEQTAVIKTGGAHVAIDDAGRTFRFGGLGRSDAGDFTLPFALNEFDATAPDGEKFVTRSPQNAPVSGRYQSAFFWEPNVNAFVVVGGQNETGAEFDVALFDPDTNTWSSLQTAGDPEGVVAYPAERVSFAWGHLARQHRLFIFGGDVIGPPVGNGCNCTNDTWALDFTTTPPQWELLRTSTFPEERRNPAFGIDPVGERFFMLGGTPNGAVTSQGMWALDLTPGSERWTRIGSLDVSGGPAARTSGGILYDAVRDRLVFGFGNNAQGIQTDLWELDLSVDEEAQ